MADDGKGIALAVAVGGFLFFYGGLTGRSPLLALKAIIQGTKPSKVPVQYGIDTTTSGTISGSYIPGVSSGGVSSDVASLWTQYGGSPQTAAFAAKVAQAESGGSATVTSANPDGGTNVGLFQLDTRGVGSGYSVQQLQNPQLNVQITIMATSNGVDWAEWSDPVVNSLPGHRYTPGT